MADPTMTPPTVGELVKNAIPRVAWEFSAWPTGRGANHGNAKFRLVLVESDCDEDDQRRTHPGIIAVLETLKGTDALGVERWHRVENADYCEASPALRDAVWGLAREVLAFDGPHCVVCGDVGTIGGGEVPAVPCAKCERGAQMAAKLAAVAG